MSLFCPSGTLIPNQERIKEELPLVDMDSAYVGNPVSLLDSTQIDALCLEWHGFTQNWTKSQFLGFMGYINAITYQLVNESGAIRKVSGFASESNPRHEIVSQIVSKLVERSRQGLLAVRSAIVGMEQQLKRWWNGGCHSPKTLWKYRQLLADWDFFRCEGGTKGKYEIPSIADVNLERLLLFYEHIEEAYCSRGWELPLHKGKTTRLLFKAVFAGVRKYRFAALGNSATEGEWTGDRTRVPVTYENGKWFDIYGVEVVENEKFTRREADPETKLESSIEWKSQDLPY
jgi:hypothetical protein